jgi:hypothetical protein
MNVYLCYAPGYAEEDYIVSTYEDNAFKAVNNDMLDIW